MATAKRTKGILEHLRRAMVAFDDVAAVKWCRIALEDGVDSFVATMEDLTLGMIEVSDLYTREEYFVPEILMCARRCSVRRTGFLEASYRLQEGKQNEGLCSIGVVEGDDSLAISIEIRLARCKILTSL